MTIRWVVFDAVGTLLAPFPSVAAIYHSVGKKFGSALTLDEVHSRFRRAFSESEFCRPLPEETWADPENLRTNEQNETGIWSAIVADVLDDVSNSEACFNEVFQRFDDVNSWNVLPGAAEGLSALHDSGFRLAIASNFDSRLNTLLDNIPAFAPIECRIISSEVGYRKPSLYFYRAAESLMQATPDEILMVGDNQVNDIRAAQLAGWQALRILPRHSDVAVAGNDEVASPADVLDWIHLRRKNSA
ncbi:MAG: HAD-IA family hydrolase [Planctomycetota bacterium]|nr:HAD-IA family hydrolase [Planctomycetota bacterium]MDA1213211.1 HAD-IA family hydrolase [Planctomycetota bacterium]